MNTEEHIKQLENKMQDNIEILSDKIDNYNKKLKEFNNDDIVRVKKTKFVLNYKLILPLFVLLYIFIYIILSKIQPDFVVDKIKNEKTFFITKSLSIFKLIIFTFAITLCVLILLYFSYYIYNLKEM